MRMAKAAVDAEMRRHDPTPPSSIAEGRHEDREADESPSVLSLSDPPLPTAKTILSTFERMKHFQLIQKAVLIAIADRIPADRVPELLETFQELDTNRNGTLMLRD